MLEHGINGFVFEHLAIIAKGGAGAAIGSFDALAGCLEVVFINVADGDSVLEQMPEVAVALAAKADETDADELAGVLAGGGFGSIEEDVWTDEGSGESGIARSPQKITPGKTVAFRHERVIGFWLLKVNPPPLP